MKGMGQAVCVVVRRVLVMVYYLGCFCRGINKGDTIYNQDYAECFWVVIHTF